MNWSRRHRRLGLRALQFLILCAFLQSLVDIFAIPRAATRAAQLPSAPLNQTVFIAAIHWNNEEILKSHWVPAVVDLAKELGPDRVFVSVQESGSWDDSKGALRLLGQLLDNINVRHKIILDDTTHHDEINKIPGDSGWIMTPRGRVELRRIPYLARLRNLVLQPLDELAAAGVRFDNILFLNDVVFKTEDIQRLLDTRGGHYAAACSLDYSKPPMFYDTFALRDSEGHAALTQKWPYFRSRASRRAMRFSEPVPVTSCWNGIVTMKSDPFYDATHPLRFRGIPDSLAKHHLEGSECCLIHIDNPLSAKDGVWLNPNVRVGYSAQAYSAVHLRAGPWANAQDVLRGSWINRILRWFTSDWFEQRVVARRTNSWTAPKLGRVEEGRACLINEMQVLVSNGWAHV